MTGKRRGKWHSSLQAALAIYALLLPPPAMAQVADASGAEDFGAWLGRTLPRPPPRPDRITYRDLPKLRPVWRAQNEAPREAELAALAPAAAPAPGEGPAQPPPPIADSAPPFDPALQPEPEFTPATPLPPPVAAEGRTAATVSPAVTEKLPLIRTADFAAGSFLRDRAALLQQLQQAAPEARAGISLALSQMMMAQLLLPEARSFHDRARAQGLEDQPELLGRWKATGIMLDILAGAPAEPEAAALLEEHSLWQLAAFASVRRLPGETGPAGASLTEAVAELQNHSEPVISRLLPKLFDMALLRGDHRIAEGLLRGAREATRLPQEPVYHLMMGRLALVYDMPEQAFDYFARAAEGHDLAAQRARIAMADLALLRKDPKLLPALRDILSEGVNQWRHDYEALILRARLAQVAEDLGDIPLALDIMGKIRQDHPGTPEAVLAHERGALALAAFAAAIEAEAISLETYLTTLRQVEPFYRLDPVWPIARKALARAYGRAGLSVAAASEYSALQIDLNRIDAPAPPEKQAAEIPLLEAEAWLLSHNPGRARLALAREGLPRFEELQGRYSLSAIAAGAAPVTALPPAFSTAPELALYARSAREAGLSRAAFAAHQKLAEGPGFAGLPGEALYAVLTAHQSGATLQATEYFNVLQNSQEGGAFPERRALFAALDTPMPLLQPLSHEISDIMLERAGSARDAARLLLAQPIDTAPEGQSALSPEPGAPTPALAGTVLR